MVVNMARLQFSCLRLAVFERLTGGTKETVIAGEEYTGRDWSVMRPFGVATL